MAEDNGMQCYISGLHAWAPQLDSAELWQQWAQSPYVPELLNAKGKPVVPPLKQVDAMQRRRFSVNCKLAIHCALAATEVLAEQPQIPNVFASLQGELSKTVSLLDSVNQQEPLSPMGFGLSVHNTAAGLYSIHAKNKAPSSSIAAGERTLIAGFVEALLLSLSEQKTVLLVITEEPLPKAWQHYDRPKNFPHGFACLLRHASLGVDEHCKSPIFLAVDEVVEPTAEQAQFASEYSPVLAFLAHYFSASQEDFVLPGQQIQFKASSEER